MLELTSKQVGCQDTLAEEVGAGGAQRGASICRLCDKVYCVLQGKFSTNGKLSKKGRATSAPREATVNYSVVSRLPSAEVHVT